MEDIYTTHGKELADKVINRHINSKFKREHRPSGKYNSEEFEQ